MSKDCCASKTHTPMILACSGGSNVGQLSNQAAVDLTQAGVGKMFCLAGLGGQLSAFVQAAEDAEHLVVIDGCPVGCAKAILAANGVESKTYLVITELGIEKNKTLTLNPDDLETVKTAVKKGLTP